MAAMAMEPPIPLLNLNLKLFVLGSLFLASLVVANGMRQVEEEVEAQRQRQRQRQGQGQGLGREADRVRNLPGQPPEVSFAHYAGYVQLANSTTHESSKALFYWFFEAQQNASQKPLVLWLNGGPGCSSIAYGAAQELGPFLVRNNGTLVVNEFAWNKVANVLFLEAPVGVGFSYTNNSNDLNTLGDGITATDSYAFLIQWFKRFPAFKSHPFYIAGESYAGHYVPQLADLIFDGNHKTAAATSSSAYINLKGFMIGNAVINDETDLSGMFDYAWSHAIISDQLHDTLVKKCVAVAANDDGDDDVEQECNNHTRTFLQSYSEIDIYAIYAPLCLAAARKATRNKPLVVAPHLLTKHHDLWHKLRSGYDPCTQNYVEQYFNREDVQKALHANVTKLSYPYTPCSDFITVWNDSPDTLLPTIQKLLKAGLRIWIYSGDTDGRVPVTSTRYSIKKMGLGVKQQWRAWFDNGQVAGWVETYDGGLTFATVRGAGHQVPVFAPRQSLSLFTHFLSPNPNTTLPSSRFLA